VLSGCYESSRFKSKAKPQKLAAVHLLNCGNGGESLAAAVAAGAGVASGSFMTRFVCVGGAGGAGGLGMRAETWLVC
jgi:hypothetical protein